MPSRAAHRYRSRRGITSILAMIYLVLFAALAIGYYAQVGASVQISSNETRSRRALLAAESGLAFARYNLHHVKIPPLTPQNDILNQIHQDLAGLINGTNNVYRGDIGFNGSRIDIPAGAGQYVQLAPGGNEDRFRIMIWQKPGTSRIVVKSIGAVPAVPGDPSFQLNRAALEIEFDTQEIQNAFWGYGMASKGTVQMLANNRIIQGVPPEQASILSLSTASPAVVIGANTNTQPTGTAGNITVVGDAAVALLGPVSVAGETNKSIIQSDHVERLDPADPDAIPEFPTPDVSIFRKYAVNPYVAGRTVYDNVIIPPNTNPTFSGPITIRGVVWIQQPNIVNFEGRVDMQCVIVTEDVGVGTLATNLIRFAGNGGAKSDLSTLPDDPLTVWPDDPFEGLQQLTGSFIIAPGFDVNMTGNFGALVGDICGDRVTIQGSAAATISGSVYTLEDQPLRIAGAAQLTFRPNPSSVHSGVRFSDRYIPHPSTYREVAP